MSCMLASSYVALAADTATRIFPWYVMLRQSELEPCCWLHDCPPELEGQSALELEPCQGLQDLEPCHGLHEPQPLLIALVWGGELKPKLQLANLRRHTCAHTKHNTPNTYMSAIIHVYPPPPSLCFLCAARDAPPSHNHHPQWGWWLVVVVVGGGGWWCWWWVVVVVGGCGGGGFLCEASACHRKRKRHHLSSSTCRSEFILPPASLPKGGGTGS